MTVLVAGASGLTGSAVLTHLLNADVETRALTRSAKNAATLERNGVDVVVTDFDDATSMQQAFHGVTAAYLVTPSDPDMAATETMFARHAFEAGAHLVKLSVIAASLDSPLRFARHHAESEASIDALGGSWTFVQPTGFMNNDLAWAAQVPSGTIVAPAMDAAWSIVDVDDVAAVATAALCDPDQYRGQRIAVTGPEARTPRDRIEALAQALGRELHAIETSVTDAKQQLLSYGVDVWTVDGIGELLDLYQTGSASDVSPDTATVLHREPHTWDEFVEYHLNDFSS